jgi:hypothetical protein
MRIKFTIILLLVIGNIASSQTIINAERLGDKVDSTVLALSFSYNGTRGNSETDRLDLSPAIVIIKKKNEFKAFGGYGLLSQADNIILNTGYIHVRHNFKISNAIRTFEFYQLQFNNVLLLDKRELVGAGLRFVILDLDSLGISFNTGAMRELEVLDENSLPTDEILETRYYRATLTSSIRYQFNKILRLDNVVYYQPYLGDLSDYRLLNDLNLSFTINNYLNLIISLSTRYDSRPPSALETLDNIISFGINLKL